MVKVQEPILNSNHSLIINFPLHYFITLDSTIVPPPLPPRITSTSSALPPPLPARAVTSTDEIITTQPLPLVLPPPRLPPPIKPPLVQGLSDNQLNIHLRRFNKQVRHLKGK